MLPRNCLYLSVFFLLVGIPAYAKKHFSITPLTQNAYEAVLSLRFEDSRDWLIQLRKTDPDNLMVYHVEDYIDFFTVYINEDLTEFKRLEANKDLRIRQVKNGDPSSPYYLYLQANIRLHWALARLKFEEYFTAFREVSKAFDLLSENARKFPDFLPNKKDLAILHAMVGTIPDNYRWGVELLSNLNGTIDQGRKELEAVIEHSKKQHFLYEKETLVIYAYLLMHLGNDSEAAWNVLQSSGLDPLTNPLACFTLANVAMRTGRNDEAIRILLNRPKGNSYHPFPYLDFMLGVAKLRRLDTNADIELLCFLHRFTGRHFIKEAYQKLAWDALLKRDSVKFREYTHRCKSEGRTVVDSDKNAQTEAVAGWIPDLSLLKARLLFDGGYYQRAYAILQEKSSGDFISSRERLEFTYRMGRIFHNLQRHNEAFRFYQKTIEAGKNEPYYFACNAALQSGLLFEQLGNAKQAKEYFRHCLNIFPSEHRTGLHQQAKAGILRLGGK